MYSHNKVDHLYNKSRTLKIPLNDSSLFCIFQCQNGHVACFSCWSRLTNKCHICSNEANFTRNIALEKVVESVKSACSYAKWGCSKLVSYSLRNAHEESCLFAPSKCPIPGCGYRGFTGWWSGHFHTNHNNDSVRF